MGGCFSKKKDTSSSPEVPGATQHPVDPIKSQKNDKALLSEVQDSTKKGEEEEEAGLVKKEIFVIKHRKSHDKHRSLSQQNEGAAANEAKEESGNNNVNVVRTSSCTKEEVDAILIQCGRLSRSNSSGKTAASSARKYSGSKRSYDFDHNDVDGDAVIDADVKKKGSDDDDDDDQTGERRQQRQRHRRSSGRSPSQGRRRTPSRERDQQQQQRSGSRERGGGGGGGGSGSGRRVSRSPGRRSENNSLATTTTNCNSNRPGKMVSVPATITSLVMDKSNNGVVEPATTTTTTAIKRITVKRNAGEAAGVAVSRTAASPRSQSPARSTNASVNKTSNESQQQPSLSRNSSRKAEHSPYRRNPLSEIDSNSLAFPQSSTPNIKPSTNNNNRVHNRSREVEGEGVLYQKPNVDQIGSQGTNYKVCSGRGTLNNKVVNTICTEKEQQQILGEAKAQMPITTMAAAAASGAESQNPQTLTRSRSSRRSRDLDLNPETLLNPTPSYTALLLEDIQNFHQNNNNNKTPSFSLPPCVTKACSILEAVADLNSTTSSNLSCAFSVGKQMREAKDPFVESEVLASDDLMEPSFHKYVTVRRGGGTLGGSDLDEQESSGSNSYVGGATQQNWSLSSSSWEPNSADSTDRWTSRSNTKEEDRTSLGHQKHALSETRKGVNGKKRDDLRQKDGIWRGRVAANKGPQTAPIVAAAST